MEGRRGDDGRKKVRGRGGRSSKKVEMKKILKKKESGGDGRENRGW